MEGVLGDKNISIKRLSKERSLSAPMGADLEPEKKICFFFLRKRDFSCQMALKPRPGLFVVPQEPGTLTVHMELMFGENMEMFMG